MVVSGPPRRFPFRPTLVDCSLIARKRHNFRHNTHAHTCTLYVRVRVYSARYYVWHLAARYSQGYISLDKKISETSVKIIKNEVGCRDDTVPKTVDTRRHCEEE